MPSAIQNFDDIHTALMTAGRVGACDVNELVSLTLQGDGQVRIQLEYPERDYAEVLIPESGDMRHVLAAIESLVTTVYEQMDYAASQPERPRYGSAEYERELMAWERDPENIYRWESGEAYREELARIHQWDAEPQGWTPDMEDYGNETVGMYPTTADEDLDAIPF